MNKQIIDIEKAKEQTLVDTEGLKAMLSCGRHSAVKLGEQASAKVKIGGRVLWSVKAVNDYIESVRM